VHTWGNINATTGASVGGHFFGTCNGTCRPGIATQEVGYLFDGAGLTADANGVALGYGVDGSIQLSGNNSIIGRSLIIHGNGTSPGAFTAQCVIGEAAVVLPTNCQYGPWSAWSTCGSTSFPDIGMLLTSRTRSVTVNPANGGTTCDDASEAKPCVDYTASCLVTASANNRVPVVGSVEFQQSVGQNLSVAVSVSGLVNASHGFHVHVYGDISDPYVMSESGHFIGDCNGTCRPNVTGMLQEVGYLNNGAPLVVTGINAVATYRFQDSVAKLYGIDSIVGRSIVIHHDGLSPSIRVAQCVIGSTGGPLDTPSSQQAACVLTATSGIGVNTITPGTVIGNASFTATATNNVWVSYNLSALQWSNGISARVYSVGDIRTIDGSATGALFSGDCTSCRPGASVQAAGLLFNGSNLTTQNPSCT
jgi:Cu/Zn superoxide dismutase